MRGRFWPRAQMKIAFAAAVLLAPAISTFAIAADTKVDMKISIVDGANQLDGGGRLYIDQGVFRYSSDTLTMTGNVAGDDVTLTGAFITVKNVTRTFKVAGKFVKGHFASAVTGSDGKKLGSVTLDLISD